MIITCTCNAKLKIGDDKLTAAGVRVKCPKCGTVHVAKRPAPGPAEPSAPSMPWFASAANVPQQERAVASPSPDAPAMPGFAPESPAPLPGAASPAPAVQGRRPVSTPVPAAAQTTLAQGRQAAPASPLVLVAHDSKVVADMVKGVVKDSGMIVEHATDGLEALKMATALKPKVMIVDVGLTGIYGFELCERLKGDPDTRSIKIILLSSVYGLTAYKRSPVTLYGADDYIEKHDIPDKLLSKIRQLLSGIPAAAAALSPAPLPKAAGIPTASPPVPETAAASAAPPAAGKSVPAAAARLAALDAADVMPRVPVTLDSARKRATPLVSPQAAPPQADGAQVTPVAAEPPAAENKETMRPEDARPVVQDESVKLDAAFFEQEEYAAAAKPPAKAAAAVDPAEIEKARRFARLVVSDIALYNQETVTEGIAKGTFFELLKDDIAEGRALYEKRVPEAVRMADDYYQEAFDNFIAAKKKQR